MPSSLNKWGHHDAMPEWTIPRSPARGIPQRTAADSIDPGTYRTERDFPTTKDDLPKGMLTGSSSAPSFTFSGEKRKDERGVLKGIHFPCNRWLNDTGPGQYDLEGPPVLHHRRGTPSSPGSGSTKSSSPRYSMPRAARVTQTIRRGPGPGEYSLPSQFGSARAWRLEPIKPTAKGGVKTSAR